LREKAHPRQAVVYGPAPLFSPLFKSLNGIAIGQTGFLVEKNDAEALAKALLVLLNDASLRETMGRAGRRRAFEHFSWLKVAEQMHARYDELLSA
jgi:glycosyltransferase involved in cell wall biosynthesis